MSSAQYILLPERNVGDALATTAKDLLRALPRTTSMLRPADFTLSVDGIPDAPMKVIDTLREDGAKLVEMTQEAADAITRSPTPLRALPVFSYGLPERSTRWFDGLNDAVDEALAAVRSRTFTVACHDDASGAPLADCRVVAFQDFERRIGAEATTGATGQVSLTLRGARIERLYVISPDSHWGAFRRDIPIVAGGRIDVGIHPVVLSNPDAVRALYGQTRFDAATPVKVGVIDTGVGPHNDLRIGKRRNTVTGEAADLADDWFGHGTHVAGLIGASATTLRGMAPGVEINVYRVFGQNGGGATNYAILKAMILAADDGCDIINLSLGGGPVEPIVMEAVEDARDHGMLVVVAAGNEGRRPVSNPAAYSGATAVSAWGFVGSFPPGSLAEADVLRPPLSASHQDDFIAGFSNYGRQIAVAAPGVALLSTLPNHRYGPMSGTSMAAPVAAGAAACLLSRDPEVYGMPRDRYRAEQIQLLLQQACDRRGFPREFVGAGVPDAARL
jgi:hypothetical protein